MPIKMLLARQVLDSSGTPTVEVDMVTDLGLFRVAAPSTDQLKKGEALQLRDDNPKQYHGMSVTRAVKNVNTIIAPELIKMNLEVTMQKEIDAFLMALDGSDNKSRLGANAILAVSLVVVKAGAAKKGMPLYRHVSELAGVASLVMPVPQFTMLVGGFVSSNVLPYQEYMIMPTGASSFAQALQMGVEIYVYMQKLLESKYGKNATFTSECGGLSTPVDNVREPFLLLTDAIKNCGYNGKVEIAVNAAAGDFYKDGAYDLEAKNPNSNPQDYVNADRLMLIYSDLCKEFSICSIMDPFERDDWAAWVAMATKEPMLLTGNDLTLSIAKRVTMAADKKACGAVALRINQTGTVSELIDAFKAAQAGQLAVVVMDRWGETEDPLLADLAVGLGAGLIKCGAPLRERLVRYNQVLRIEEELGAFAKYAGKNYRAVSS